MLRKIGMVCGLSLGVCLAALVSGPAGAAKPVAIEKELLGVRILQNYRQVLARYGAPTRIFRATETVHWLFANDLQGNQTGGVLGVDDASSGGGGGGGSYAGGGYPGGGGGYPGVSGGPPGSSGGGGAYPGAPAAAGGGGGGGASGDDPDATFGEAGGFTWVYLYPGKELAYEFRFNKDGRIERIEELGRGFGQHTSRGIGLGDTIDKVYSVYGWTDRVKEEDSGKFSLLYNDRYHVHFLIIKNKVVGISVFLKENQFMHFDGGSGGGGGSISGGGGKPVGGPVASGGGGGGKPSGPPAASGGGGGKRSGVGSGRAD